MTAIEPRQRADAQANRKRLLEVALAAITDDPAVSLTAIAKAAGVGVGTLYRHFPTRESLVVAVYREELDGLVALGHKLLASKPPFEALRRWTDRLAGFGRTKHGIANIVHTAIADEDREEVYGPMMGIVAELLAACEAAGAIRPGLATMDFFNLVNFLWRVTPDAQGQAQARRLLDIVFDGLATRPAAR
jgi:AcrR family transcriptional regulator